MNDALTIERLYDLRLGPMAEAFAEEVCQWPFESPHWWPSESLHPHSSFFFGVVRLDLASFMR